VEGELGVDIERLNQQIEKSGLDLGQLEYLSSVNYDTLYKIRTAKRPSTSAKILARLAKALDCSLDYLVGLTDDPRPYYDSDKPESIRSVQRIMRGLTSRRQSDLLALAMTLLNLDMASAERSERAIYLNKTILDTIRNEYGEETMQQFLTIVERIADSATGTSILDLLDGSDNPSEEEEEE
jgi:transcriptional regulator with XRE-family HTH domain